MSSAAMTSSAAPSSVSMPSVPTTPIYHFVTVKLSDDNFLLWPHQIESYLHGNKLFKFVDGSFPYPATSSSDHEKHHLELTGNGTCAKKSLKMIQSDLEAQNIENLDVTELTLLEKQLDAMLRQTRSRKTQLMMETITALVEKGKKLGEEKDLMEKEIAALMVEKANQSEEPAAIPAANDNDDDEEMEGEREGEREADEHSSCATCAHPKHPVLNLF